MNPLIDSVANVAMSWNYRVWGFGEAIALRALLRADQLTQRPEYFGFVHGVMRTWLGRGVARTNEDHVGAGRELVMLYRRTGDDRFLDAARAVAQLNAGFSANELGARYHRSDTPGWRHQIWVDCMDVDGPFLAALAAETGDEKYATQAVSELLGYARTLQSDDGLLFHGFERDSGRNGTLWARGNGWALMGLVDTLLQLPRTQPGWQELHHRLVVLLEALAAHQDASGLWHTIIDDRSTYLESTLAAMTAYGLHEAFAGDLLDVKRFGGMEQKARAAMHAQTGADGVLNLVSDATPVGAHATYATRPFGVFPWGQGPLLLALCQEAA